MSYCRQDGKDEIIFATNDDLGKPSSALIKSEEDDEPGLILPSGEINWNCPCLGGMASGPCGVSFREAFSCFHFSQSDPKGSDCYQQFRAMQECMSEYPELYPEKDDDNDLDLNKVSDEHGEVHLVEPHLETSREQCEENLPS